MYQYYGIDISSWDIDYLDEVYGMRLIATLATQLPWTSRVFRAADPRAEWGVNGLLLARIEFWLHSIIYSFTEDAKHKLNAPTMIYPETEEQKQERLKVVVDGKEFKRAQMDYETYMQIIEANVRGDQDG